MSNSDNVSHVGSILKSGDIVKKSKGSERNGQRMPGERDKGAQGEFLMIIGEVLVCQSARMPMVVETAML